MLSLKLRDGAARVTTAPVGGLTDHTSGSTSSDDLGQTGDVSQPVTSRAVDVGETFTSQHPTLRSYEMG